jgi:hypothetical protein
MQARQLPTTQMMMMTMMMMMHRAGERTEMMMKHNHNVVTTVDDDTFEDDEAARARLFLPTRMMMTRQAPGLRVRGCPAPSPAWAGEGGGATLEPRGPGACYLGGRGAFIVRRPPERVNFNILDTCTHTHITKTHITNAACAVRGSVSYTKRICRHHRCHPRAAQPVGLLSRLIGQRASIP